MSRRLALLLVAALAVAGCASAQPPYVCHSPLAHPTMDPDESACGTDGRARAVAEGLAAANDCKRR